jgi:hypothetical protein
MGAWGKAAAAADEALPLAAGTGHPGLTALPTVQQALVAALRGDPAADERLAEAAGIRERHPVGITDSLVVDMRHWARGLRAAAQPTTAMHHLAQVFGPALRRLAALDLFDLALRAGRLDVLRAWLDDITTFADGTGTPSVPHKSCGPRARPLAAATSPPPPTSPHRNARWPPSSGRGCRTGTSPRSCSSAPAPSTSTCATCSASSA